MHVVGLALGIGQASG